MSEQAFYILPSDPDYMPTPKQRSDFDAYFMDILGVADSHYLHLTDEPMLVSYCEVSRVRCPACGSTLRMFTPEYEPSPHYAWFESVRTLPAYAPVEPPCCGARIKANELELLPAVPYARFARGALNPEMAEYWNEDLTLVAEVAARFEQLLGAPIKQFWESGT